MRYQITITVKAGANSVQVIIVLNIGSSSRCGSGDEGQEHFSTGRERVDIYSDRHQTLVENPGASPLEIIEIQSGSYLGEDDIVRFEDRYGRQ